MTTSTTTVQMQLELMNIPVTDIDRARDFYVQQCGWELITDHVQMGDMRIVQIDPPGSGCGILMGRNIPEITDMPAGDAEGHPPRRRATWAPRATSSSGTASTRGGPGPRRRALHAVRGPGRQHVAAAAVARRRDDGRLVTSIALRGRRPRPAQPGLRGARRPHPAGDPVPAQARAGHGRPSSASRSR